MRRDIVAQARATYNELAAQIRKTYNESMAIARDGYLRSVDETRASYEQRWTVNLTLIVRLSGWPGAVTYRRSTPACLPKIELPQPTDGRRHW